MCKDYDEGEVGFWITHLVFYLKSLGIYLNSLAKILLFLAGYLLESSIIFIVLSSVKSSATELKSFCNRKYLLIQVAIPKLSELVVDPVQHESNFTNHQQSAVSRTPLFVPFLSFIQIPW